MSCSFDKDFAIGPNASYSDFDATQEQCSRTYLRPDPGGSMMPFILVVLLLLFHLPACLIRAVQWESAQYLALGLAVLGIALTVQAYVSTSLQPGEILVWMPLTLILDVGAMMQMVVLIIEKHHIEGVDGVRRGGMRILWNALKDFWHSVKATMKRRVLRRGTIHQVGKSLNMEVIQERHDSMFNEQYRQPESQASGEGHALLPPPLTLHSLPRLAGVYQAGPPVQEQLEPARSLAESESLHANALRYATVALSSFILLLLLLTLQVIALVYATRGRSAPNLTVNWCSPTFRDFAVAVSTGNCKVYSVHDSSSNGIGCISLSGSQQKDWLLGTQIALVVALTSEMADLALLLLTDSETRIRKTVKVQRPWATMFGGVIILIVLISFGAFGARHLPEGVTETVWIWRKEVSSPRGRVCRGTLDPPGLRGVMIGYMDGLFSAWGGVYSGKS